MKAINYQKASFFTSAAKVIQCPADSKREVAFAGRSNAGKSSALNALTGIKKLARMSKTPGRTRLINFFQLVNHVYLVDLPGYGYARVSESIKREWQYHLHQYLTHRQALVGLVLLVDIRHELKPFDKMMLDWSLQARMPLHILLTKSDKLSYSAGQKALNLLEERLCDHSFISVQIFSSLKKTGVDILTAQLNTWLVSDDETEASL